MPASSRAFAMLAFAALLAPVIARADFEDDYAAGLAALNRGDNTQAAQVLKKALAARPEYALPVRIEGVPQPYLPHHFLGMAYFRLGDCAAARDEWNDPSNLRLLGRLRQVRDQEAQLLAQCKPSAAKETQEPAAQPQATPPVAATPATAASAQISNPQSKPATVAVAGPPPVLLRAYSDFVAGRIASAARLDVDAVNGANVRFQAYLLRSAARFALARSGETSQLDGARSDARAARQLDANALPDERVFSPAFRAFFAAAH